MNAYHFHYMPRVLSFGAVLLITGFGCGGGGGSDAGGEVSWQYGPATEYVVSGSALVSVPDPVSGGTFYFPAGGEGRLTVAPIVAAPLGIPENSRVFGVTYTGTEPMEFHVARQADSVTFLSIAGHPDYSTYDPVPEAGAWLSVAPHDLHSDTVVFHLMVPGRLPAAVSAATATASPTLNVASSTYQFPPAVALQELERLDAQLALTIDGLIGKLPLNLQPSVRNAVTNGPLQRHETVFAIDVSAYQGLEHYSYPEGYVPFAFFALVTHGPTKATASTLAHESGHYLSHLLLGSDTFNLLEGEYVEVHDFAVVNPDRPMLEEYAQFADQVMNGMVRLRPEWDLTEPIETLREASGFPELGPANRNWPALEGYGAALMTCLAHNNYGYLARGISHATEEIPNLVLSVEDVFGILAARKPLTVDQLRAAIAGHLASIGRDDAFPAFLERTGWSYHARGVVLDAQSNAVKGATVQSVCKVASENGREYLAPLAPATTGRNGEFTLDRVFPGDTLIRVCVGSRTQDFLRVVNPAASTKEEVDLKNLQLADAKFSKLSLRVDIKRKYNTVIAYPSGGFAPGVSILDTDLYQGNGTPTLNMTANTFDYKFTSAWDSSSSTHDTVTMRMTDCTFGSGGSEITSCKVEQEWKTVGIYDAETISVSFVLTGIPLYSEDPSSGERTYLIGGAQCATHLHDPHEVTEAKNNAGTIIGRWDLDPASIDWTSTDNSPLIRIIFRK